MSCLRIENVSTPSQVIARKDCLTSTQSKASLLVIGLLFGTGGALFYFAYLSVPGLVAFSLVSVVCAAAFIISCVQSDPFSKKAAEETISLDDEKNQMTDVNETKVTPLPQKDKTNLSDEIKSKMESKTNFELLDLIHPSNELATPNKHSNLEALNNWWAAHFLNINIGNFLESAENYTAATEFLQPLFTYVESDDRFKSLIVACAVIESGLPPNTAANILERIEWGNEGVKRESLYDCFSSYLKLVGGIVINVTASEEGDGKRFWQLSLAAKTLFGEKDFLNEPEPIAESLAYAIGVTIRNMAIEKAIELKKVMGEGSLTQDTKVGIDLRLYDPGCPLPRTMLAPIFSYIKEVPGLVRLDLGVVDLGKNKFYKSDAQRLREVLQENPYLLEVKFFKNSVTKGFKKFFYTHIKPICNQRTQDFDPQKFSQHLIEAAEQKIDPS